MKQIISIVLAGVLSQVAMAATVKKNSTASQKNSVANQKKPVTNIADTAQQHTSKKPIATSKENVKTQQMADTAQTQTETKQSQSDSAQKVANTEATPPVKSNTESTFKDVITKAKVSGFGFARYFTIDGKNGGGQAQQYRMKLDVTTGQIYGVSATAGVFFSQGSSTPDVGKNTDSAVQGGRGSAYNANFSDRFNISNIYASKEFKKNSLSAKIDIGKMDMKSPFNNSSVDLGTGGVLNISHKAGTGKMKYHLSFYDSWSGDHAGYNIRVRSPKNGTTELKNQDAASIGIGNNVILAGLSGEKLLNNSLSFSLYGGNIWEFVDFMGYGDLAYNAKIGSGSFKLMVQTSVAMLNKNPRLALGFNGSSITSNFDTELQKAAKMRGIYNVQASYKTKYFSAKLGYLGSFGDGYGTLMDYKGNIDVAGKVWNGNFTATYEGLGIFGSGSFSGSNINVAYLAMSAGFKIPLKIGLDVAYVFGNTNMPILKVYNGKNPITHSTIDQKQQFLWKADFVEITPSISYKFTKQLDLSFFVATFLGDIQFFKTRTELKYTF